MPTSRSIALACAVLLLAFDVAALSLSSLEGLVLGRRQAPQRFFGTASPDVPLPVVTVEASSPFSPEHAVEVSRERDATTTASSRWMRECTGKRARFRGPPLRCPERRRARDPPK